jgi:hypothetical protein
LEGPIAEGGTVPVGSGLAVGGGEIGDENEEGMREEREKRAERIEGIEIRRVNNTIESENVLHDPQYVFPLQPDIFYVRSEIITIDH